jgi:hypothetical protein
MEKHRLEEFKGGWFIGNFEPSLLKRDFEVGLHRYQKGEIRESHFHKKITEYNLMISGQIRINDLIFEKGDIFIIEPYTVSNDILALTDCEILIVKDGSDTKDKYTYEIKYN